MGKFGFIYNLPPFSLYPACSGVEGYWCGCDCGGGDGGEVTGCLWRSVLSDNGTIYGVCELFCVQWKQLYVVTVVMK